MGCYNGTCFLSNLPIERGEKIVIIPIMKSNNYERGTVFSYSDDAFEVAGPVIRGEYNDYGGIKNIKEDELSKLFFKSINKNLDHIKLYSFGKKSEFDEDVSNLENFLNNVLSRGAIYDNRYFGFIMINEEIFNETVGKLKNTYFDEISEIKKNEYTKNVESFKKAIEGKEVNNNLGDIYELFTLEIPIGHNYHTYNPIFLTIKKELSSKLDLLKETQNFVIFCELTRKLIFPTSGAGSQMDLTREQKNLSNAIKNRISKIEKVNKMNNF